MKTNLRYRVYLYIGVAVAAYLLSPFRVGVVWGDSMSPSLHHGEMYLFDRQHDNISDLRRGDVVIFQREGRNYIKRVAALPGDVIYLMNRGELDGPDEVVLDWQLPKLQAALDKKTWKGIKLMRRRMPKDCIYVLGDHMEISEDSRTFGPVYQDQLRGRLVVAPPPTNEQDHVAGRYMEDNRS